MELRRWRGAGRGRAPLRGARLAVVATGLYLAAGILATAPAIGHAWTDYLAWGERPAGRVSPGDHLQVGYQLWLVGHQLERREPPWRDPYSFRPEAEPRPSYAGWPLGLAYWPLERVLGGVRAWNALVLLAFVACGGLTAAWLLELGLPRAASLAGGVVFALAPYRVAQSTEHLLGLIAFLIPLALLGLERGKRGRYGWLAIGVASAASIPLSGQVHLALAAVPFAAAYALWRGMVWTAAAVFVASGAAGLLVYETLITTSTESQGRTLAEVSRYSAEPLDFLSRTTSNGIERVVFVGWLTALLALVGLALILRLRRFDLAALLGLGALLPIALALGTHLPAYDWLWRHVEPFRFPRVPERLLPVAALALAALVALALASIRRQWIAVAALPLLALDLWIGAFGASAADPANPAYAALDGRPPGRVLDVPVFRPERYLGSVYLEYAPQAPRERPGGYSTLAPPVAERTLRRLRPLNCGADRARLLRRLGVRYVVLHRPLFAADGIAACEGRAARAIRDAGFRRETPEGDTVLYTRSDA